MCSNLWKQDKTGLWATKIWSLTPKKDMFKSKKGALPVCLTKGGFNHWASETKIPSFLLDSCTVLPLETLESQSRQGTWSCQFRGHSPRCEDAWWSWEVQKVQVKLINFSEFEVDGGVAKNGGFLKWGCHNSWMVYFMEHPNQRMITGGYPLWLRKPPIGDHAPIVCWETHHLCCEQHTW